MNYKYRELDYARTIYEHGFQSAQHQPTELCLVATYMRRFLDYKPKRLTEALYQWCESHIPGYQKEVCYKMIQSAIRSACKKGSTLINIDSIAFYPYEMDYIQALSISENAINEKESSYSYACKKTIFTLLFLMKIKTRIAEAKGIEQKSDGQGHFFQGGQRKYTELKKLAKLPEKVKINEDIINTLWVNGLVTPMFRGMIRLDFMDQLQEIQNSAQNLQTFVALQIQDFDSVGWYYDLYEHDKKIAFCKECGNIFRKKSNRQEYCSCECSKSMDRRKAKERMQTLRNAKGSIMIS